jgi:hypothetical protein
MTPLPDTPGGSPPITASATASPSEPSPRNLSPTPTRTPTSPPSPGSEQVLAPIESVDLVVRESSLPQYALRVRAGLPNGCARPAGHEVGRGSSDPTNISVRVYNSQPPGNVACTQIYGTYELVVELGTDFKSGEQYRVDVNGKSVNFTAR